MARSFLLLWSLWDFAPCHTEELDTATVLWVNEAVSDGLNILLVVGKITLFSGEHSCLRGNSGFLGLDNLLLGTDKSLLALEQSLFSLKLCLFAITIVLGFFVGSFGSLFRIFLSCESCNISRTRIN